jgi:signal peptide peptidase SppA
MRYPHIWQAVLGTPWAITPTKLSAIVEALARRERGEDLEPEEIRAMVGAVQQPQSAPPGQRIAVVNVIGVLAQRVSPMQEMSGATSTERIGAAFREALADPDIATIVLNIDSPGGNVAGTPELADLVARGAQQKRVVAVANSLAASAAYWIASQAEALYVTPSGLVGSIGVILAHEDVSRLLEASGITVSLITAGEHKGELNPFKPLSDEDRAAAQAMCDYFYGLFTRPSRAAAAPRRRRCAAGWGRAAWSTRARPSSWAWRTASTRWTA